jgi:uncharacterized LabA/DUF88 family protein
MQILHALPEDSDLRNYRYTKNTYAVAGVMNYLIGVPLRLIGDPLAHARIEPIYKTLEQNKKARIIRNLCIVRADMIRDYGNIVKAIQYEFKTIRGLPQYISKDALAGLSKDGVPFATRHKSYPSDYIIDLNKLILNHINNCKDLFPTWLNWDYVREVFIMPDGLTSAGCKVAHDTFHANKNSYPMKIYLNWIPGDQGNILLNDEKFVTLLYEQHEDSFTDMSKITNIGDGVLTRVYDFFSNAQHLIFIVDCENADPFRFYTVLNSLDENELLQVSKIILIDNADSFVWNELEKRIDIPFEHIVVGRLKSNKSQVDMTLALRATRAYYEEHVDSFVLVSSDSDYWALIDALEQAQFLLLVEDEKCSPIFKKRLHENQIFYCPMNRFYSGAVNEFKDEVIALDLANRIQDAVQVNVQDFLDQSLRSMFTTLDEATRQDFYKRHIKDISCSLDDDGNLQISLASAK